jgi:hypothetical protein
MSGSYLALKSQINQILALTIANGGGGGTQNLEQVLTEGSDAAGLPITGLTSLSGASVNLGFTELTLNADPGTAGQVIASQGPFLPAIWVDTAAEQGLASVLGVDNDAAQLTAVNFSAVSAATGDNAAIMGGTDGFRFSNLTSAIQMVTAGTACILDFQAPPNQGNINVDPTQMLIQTSNFPLNLVNKGILLDGAAGDAGDLLKSNGAGAACTWSKTDLQAVLDAGNESTTPILIVSDEDNYTELLHNPATLVGLVIHNEFFGSKTATLASNTLTLTDVQPPQTFNTELGTRLDLNVVNGAAEVQRCFYETNRIQFLSNVGGGNVDTLYTGTGLTTNQGYTITAPTLDMVGQASFDTPPHSVLAINGNDLVTKGYVDSLAGQYSGGQNLFLNYSVDDGIYKSLGLSVVAAAQQTVLVTTDGTNQEVAAFVTAPLGFTEIPSGIWNLLLFAEVDSPGGLCTYFFELLRLRGGVESSIATSGSSTDVNSTAVPTAFPINCTIVSPIAVLLTDQIVLRIYVHHDGAGKVVTTYFQNVYYSFSQSTLNAGTTLLGSNNTWTGNNDFVLAPTTPYKASPGPTDIVNFQKITETLVPIVSTLQYFLTAASPFFQYPPAQPSAALIASSQYYGWYFKNAVALRKIDWFFAPDYAMTVSEVKGLYMNYFNVAATSNEDLPFISIYTKPTGSGDVIPGFAHSVCTFVAAFTPTINTAWCSFMNISGVEPDPFPYGHRLGAMILSPVAPNPRGSYLPTEEVLAISVGTNSTAAVNAVEFTMGKVGICLAQGNQENILQPTDIFPTLGQVLANGNSAAADVVLTGAAKTNTLRSTGVTIQDNIEANVKGLYQSTSFTLQNGLKYMTGSATDGLSFTDVATGGFSTYKKESIVTNASVPVFDISVNALTLSGVASTSGQVVTANASGKPIWAAPASGWTDTATSSLNMASFGITACASVDAAAALTLGGTTALGVNVGRAAQITDLLGNVRVNSSSGTSGQVLTSTGASTAPTWQPAPAGSLLPFYNFGPTVINSGFPGSATRAVFDNATFQNVVVTSVTAKYLITGQLLVNGSGVTTNLWATLGVRTGGGEQSLPANVRNAFNGILMTSQTSFNQLNSLSQCSVSASNVFNKLEFSIVVTPGAINTFSYAIWYGTSGGAGGTMYTLTIQQLAL